MCSFVCAVDRGVPEEEREEEFDREPEPEDQYREQELPEGFENGKSNLTRCCIFLIPSFSRHNLMACFIKCIMFHCKTWLDSHPLIVMIIPCCPIFISKYELLCLDDKYC